MPQVDKQLCNCTCGDEERGVGQERECSVCMCACVAVAVVALLLLLLLLLFRYRQWAVTGSSLLKVHQLDQWVCTHKRGGGGAGGGPRLSMLLHMGLAQQSHGPKGKGRGEEKERCTNPNEAAWHEGLLLPSAPSA